MCADPDKDGSVVEYFQLAHNERHPENKKPAAHIIHSFGRADQLDRDDLVRLCRSIAQVCGLEKELAKHPDKKATAQWAIELLASKRYKRYLSITKSEQVHIDYGKIHKAEKYDGNWVLETKDDTICLEDAACGYKGLMIIERCFRSLKRMQIKMSPMYHWLPRRIETHVRICVLSLLIERVAELACKKPWSQIRQKLDGLQVSEFQTPAHRFFKLNEATVPLIDTLKMLGIPLPAGVFGLRPLSEDLSNL